MARLKASTIIESVIAMSILVTILSISFLFIGSMINGPNNVSKWRVQMAIQKIAQTTKDQESYQDEIIDSLNFRVQKKIIPYQKEDNLFYLEIIAYDKNDLAIAKHREIVKIK